MWKFGIGKKMLFVIWEQEKYINQGKEEKAESSNEIFKEKSGKGILKRRIGRKDKEKKRKMRCGILKAKYGELFKRHNKNYSYSAIKKNENLPFATAWMDQPRGHWNKVDKCCIFSLMKSKSESHSVVSDSLQPHGLYAVHGILQARIPDWVVIPFSRGSSQPRDQTQVSHIAGGFFTSWATREAHVGSKNKING